MKMTLFLILFLGMSICFLASIGWWLLKIIRHQDQRRASHLTLAAFLGLCIVLVGAAML
ncbi:hypothetical protein IV38_GL000654 [Lactobacillus selangorensis]|uniref:Uncharacterized protein n=1 Tax=Lactobacillus selangorensis TaxID=81857 RepID=A0A0R2G905_9LACO|nr:hypothetical protein [Lactobacillus selangorensis]KRN29765.1 hypothetical protein IV38_GL000654 [Lactobacillus selangorensis]KRN33706.1 hypothetical protein IV40_GL000014 [Lactobacillus selangorensis]